MDRIDRFEKGEVELVVYEKDIVDLRLSETRGSPKDVPYEPNNDFIVNKIIITSSLDDDQGSAYNELFKSILLDEKVFQSENALKCYIEFNPEQFASTDIRGQIAHEYGHAITNLIMQNTGISESKLEEIMYNLLNSNGIKTNSDIKKEISYYATKNVHELFSEAVSNVQTMPVPKPICKKIYSVLKLLHGGLL